jgi:hypothetical protein
MPALTLKNRFKCDAVRISKNREGAWGIGCYKRVAVGQVGEYHWRHGSKDAKSVSRLVKFASKMTDNVCYSSSYGEVNLVQLIANAKKAGKTEVFVHKGFSFPLT